ncbi:GTP cyclohydrolase II [Pseudoalteromonas citrea]|nr:GTP cyclohydrolase II [Pseudoalteromonas citrea]
MMDKLEKLKSSEVVSVRNSTLVPLGDYAKPSEMFSFYGLEDGKEHIVIALGDWENVEVPLVRLHSECLTGDVFNSRKCDCGEQLEQSINEIYEHGGFVVYLRQEGRGIGLYNKIDAYRLQQQGIDTFTANTHLGFEDDQRSFKVAADMLTAIGVKKVILLSNNPDKKAQLEANGMSVEKMQNTGVFHNEHNYNYLLAKVKNSNHKINLPR